MTIDEAIRIIQYNLDELLKGADPDTEQAFKLGIEALKRIKRSRGFRPGKWPRLLPGETKED